MGIRDLHLLQQAMILRTCLPCSNDCEANDLNLNPLATLKHARLCGRTALFGLNFRTNWKI